jgi:hypothetical protein
LYDLLGAFVSLTLSTGVAAAEVLPEQFLRLSGKLPADRLLVRVHGQQEFHACANAGAQLFIATAEVFEKEFCTGDYPAVTVEVVIPTLSEFENGNYLYHETWAKRAGGFRVSGLRDIMAEDYRKIFAALCGRFGERLSLNVENGAFCATAACFEWVNSGAAAVCASFAGESGCGFLEELLAALNVHAGTQFDLTAMPRFRQLYERLSSTTLMHFKPVAGSDIFAFESGIHADGIFKNPVNYEPFRPESVGCRRRLVIGKHSGRKAIRVKMEQLNLFADDALIADMNDAIRAESMRMSRSLRDEEIRGIYRGLA